jgi:hypothetical protein
MKIGRMLRLSSLTKNEDPDTPWISVTEKFNYKIRRHGSAKIDDQRA